ncbi:Ral GTPase-activating protein subunit alpha-1 [Cichlidogyrus casuarinus]|uniref:Ral GTPase-activating protein subunit alpha-1 n=1 Tax=Cichlidogyrus casuarinus TaxID=1844966 RepID=A0ABD2PYC3_9PLAT
MDTSSFFYPDGKFEVGFHPSFAFIAKNEENSFILFRYMLRFMITEPPRVNWNSKMVEKISTPYTFLFNQFRSFYLPIIFPKLVLFLPFTSYSFTGNFDLYVEETPTILTKKDLIDFSLVPERYHIDPTRLLLYQEEVIRWLSDILYIGPRELQDLEPLVMSISLEDVTSLEACMQDATEIENENELLFNACFNRIKSPDPDSTPTRTRYLSRNTSHTKSVQMRNRPGSNNSTLNRFSCHYPSSFDLEKSHSGVSMMAQFMKGLYVRHEMIGGLPSGPSPTVNASASSPTSASSAFISTDATYVANFGFPHVSNPSPATNLYEPIFACFDPSLGLHCSPEMPKSEKPAFMQSRQSGDDVESVSGRYQQSLKVIYANVAKLFLANTPNRVSSRTIYAITASQLTAALSGIGNTQHSLFKAYCSRLVNLVAQQLMLCDRAINRIYKHFSRHVRNDPSSIEFLMTVFMQLIRDNLPSRLNSSPFCWMGNDKLWNCIFTAFNFQIVEAVYPTNVSAALWQKCLSIYSESINDPLFLANWKKILKLILKQMILLYYNVSYDEISSEGKVSRKRRVAYSVTRVPHGLGSNDSMRTTTLIRSNHQKGITSPADSLPVSINSEENSFWSNKRQAEDKVLKTKNHNDSTDAGVPSTDSSLGLCHLSRSHSDYNISRSATNDETNITNASKDSGTLRPSVSNRCSMIKTENDCDGSMSQPLSPTSAFSSGVSSAADNELISTSPPNKPDSFRSISSPLVIDPVSCVSCPPLRSNMRLSN